MLIYAYNVCDMRFSNVFFITFSNGSGMTFSTVSGMTFFNASGMTFSNVYGMTFSNVSGWNAIGLTFSNVFGMTWSYVTKLYYGVTSPDKNSPVDDLINIGYNTSSWYLYETYFKLQKCINMVNTHDISSGRFPELRRLLIMSRKGLYEYFCLMYTETF